MKQIINIYIYTYNIICKTRERKTKKTLSDLSQNYIVYFTRSGIGSAWDEKNEDIIGNNDTYSNNVIILI